MLSEEELWHWGQNCRCLVGFVSEWANVSDKIAVIFGQEGLFFFGDDSPLF